MLLTRDGLHAPKGPLEIDKSNPVARGLTAAYLPFADTSGDRFTRDILHGEVLNEVGGTPTRIVSELGARVSRFNSNDEYLRATAPARLVDATALANLTLMIIVKRLGAMTANATIAGVNVANPHASPWTSYLLGTPGGSTTNLAFFTSNGGAIREGPRTLLTQNQTHWVVGTQTSGSQRIFRDGKEDGTATTLTGSTSYTNGWVGLGNYTGAGRNANCDVMAMLIWNRVLSDAEIWHLYNPSTRWDLYKTPRRVIGMPVAAVAAVRQSQLMTLGVS